MNKEEVKKLLPVLQAFAEGRTIECRYNKESNNLWHEIQDISYNSDLDYRIKPKPKYCKFSNELECWDEMKKHTPFGWIKNTHIKFNITNVYYDGVGIMHYCDNTQIFVCWGDLFDNYQFIDGSPVGKSFE